MPYRIQLTVVFHLCQYCLYTYINFWPVYSYISMIKKKKKKKKNHFRIRKKIFFFKVRTKVKLDMRNVCHSPSLNKKRFSVPE